MLIKPRQHLATLSAQPLGRSEKPFPADRRVLSSGPLWTPPTRTSLLRAARPARAVPAEDYTSQFHRTQGWTGADGTYSVPLADGSTLWLFSDTFIGSVRQDGSRAPGLKFVNNTVAHQTSPGQVEFFHGGREGEPQALFTPPDGKGWFWLHDAHQNREGTVQVLLGQFDRTPEGGALGFEAVGNWVGDLKMTTSGPKVTGYTKLDHFQKGGDGKPSIFFGSATLREKDWLYLYGVRDYGHNKESVLARVRPDQLKNDDDWQFFTGSEWSSEMDEAGTIADNVSVEYSVHRTAVGDYAMVSQKGGAGPEVQVRRAPSPEGPWSEPTTVWSAPENKGQDLAYNAKAHPELSDERGLLISYNVNSLDWERNLKVADVYRPRFIRVPDPTLLA